MFSRNISRLISRNLIKFKRFNSSSSSKQFFSTSQKFLLVSGFGIIMTYNYQALTEGSSLPIEAIKKDIAAAIEEDSKKRGNGTSMGPTLVRLAWHASGTYSATDGTGGSNGATMRFAPECEWGANAGLKSARDFLEPIKQKYPNISYADLWTLAGATAIEEMGGPKIPWRPGRTDSDAPTTVPNGRLPSADSGSLANDVAHVRSIFSRMGFSDKEIVALVGAHAVGRCHTEASGYWGPWTNAETTFSNEYFRLLLEEKWTPKKTHQGKKWEGPAQFENPDGTLMMLPADLCLVQSSEFKPYVELYAKDETQFFNDFAAAFSKLLELGVKFPEKKKGFFQSIFGF